MGNPLAGVWTDEPLFKLLLINIGLRSPIDLMRDLSVLCCQHFAVKARGQ